MRKALFTLMCLFAMMAASSGLKAQEITITLHPGWTWISYTNAEAMDIADALGDYVPMVGDIIKSQEAMVSYQNNGTWRGSFSQFIPGKGYHYYSNRTEDVSFVFAGATSQVVVVITTEPTDVTSTSAVVGGTVDAPEGTHVFLRGMCWGTAPNPDIDGDHTSDGTGAGSFSSTLEGLTTGFTYYVRAYAVSDYGLAYGNEMSFITEHEYVDLGLPSRTLWATCNVGANSPEDYGDYFAWGETSLKSVYNWSTYLYSNGFNENGDGLLTKYCNNPACGYNGFTDGFTALLPEDDAATANWGAGWRMPTYYNWVELYNNTTSTWTTQNGVVGMLFTASNGNSIFLPAAGFRYDSHIYYAGTQGGYWSKSLNTDDAGPRFAGILTFGSSYSLVDSWTREYGLSVRAVRSSSQNPQYTISVSPSPMNGGLVSGGGSYTYGRSCTVTATPNAVYSFLNWTENGNVVSTNPRYSFTVTANRTLVANFIVTGGNGHGYVDLGLPSGTLWATCNVGADAPEDYGDYFAWGETQPKNTYNWYTYQYCNNGDWHQFTKYCNNPTYGYNGFCDDLITLLPEDDAATANWGSDWRMPTKEEFQELYNNTTSTWTTQNGVNGRLFTASNGNSLFLPAAGGRGDSDLFDAGSDGYYWSSSLESGTVFTSWMFYFDSLGYVYSGTRDGGYSVRAVLSSAPN